MMIMNDQKFRTPFEQIPFSLLLVVLYVIAHALAVVSLLAFGFFTDGWVLHPLAVSWYGLFVVASGTGLWRDKHNREAWLLVIGPLLMLAGLGAFSITGFLRATYAPYDLFELHELFVWLNVLVGFLMSMAALLYRWPRLILSWAIVQGGLLVAYPIWWLALWAQGTWGSPMQIAAIGLGLPLLYFLTLRALGGRLVTNWRINISLGLLLIVVAVVRRALFIHDANYRAAMEVWQEVALAAPFMMAFGALVLPMPFLAARTLRDTPPRQIRFPWEALLLLLWGTTTLSLGFLQIGASGSLPAAGETQGWVSSEHVVPNGWLPTIIWAGWLWQAVRWLLLPYGIAFGVAHLRRMRHIKDKTLPLKSSIALIIFLLILLTYTPIGWWLGVSPALSFLFEAGPFDDSFSWLLLACIALLLAERASEHHGKSWFWRTVTLGSLLIVFNWGISRFGWLFDLNFDPTVQHIPAPPLVWIATGINTLVVALTLLALGRSGQKWSTSKQQRGLMVLLRQLIVPVAIIGTVGFMWWWLTKPPILATVPANGATDVPRNTVIQVEMAPQPWLDLFRGSSGSGLFIRYTDSDETIQGMTGGLENGYHFNPDDLLRPNAEVLVTVHRQGKRPYTLRFTTVGSSSPLATPLPKEEQIGPLPIEPPITPIPTENPTSLLP